MCKSLCDVEGEDVSAPGLIFWAPQRSVKHCLVPKRCSVCCRRLRGCSGPSTMEYGKERVVALVDMDCFYVQVEQRLNPALKNTPCVVAQYKTWKGGGWVFVTVFPLSLKILMYCTHDCTLFTSAKKQRQNQCGDMKNFLTFLIITRNSSWMVTHAKDMQFLSLSVNCAPH